MNVATIAAEAARSALAQRVASTLVALLCGAVCTVTLLTVGSTAAAEAQVMGRLNAAGSRLLIVTDTKRGGLVTPAVIGVLGAFNTVERVAGVDAPFDVTNEVLGDGGLPVPAWSLLGSFADVMMLTRGRWPRSGEALVSEQGRRTLGLVEPAGAVTDRIGREFPVVGSFKALPPFEFLDAGVVVSNSSAQAATSSAYVVVTSASAARITERAVVATLGPTSLSALNIQSPTALADLESAVGGDLGGFSRKLLFLTLGGGGFLVTVVVLAEVLLRRRDLGRRRALGAPRWGLVTLVIIRTAVAAAPGVLLGLVVGAIAARQWAEVPPFGFVAGTGILTLIMALMAAAPPAVIAAWRDPVSVLRTP